MLSISLSHYSISWSFCVQCKYFWMGHQRCYYHVWKYVKSFLWNRFWTMSMHLNCFLFSSVFSYFIRFTNSCTFVSNLYMMQHFLVPLLSIQIFPNGTSVPSLHWIIVSFINLCFCTVLFDEIFFLNFFANFSLFITLCSI